MKNIWNLIYYETKDGKSPVENYIDSLPKNNQAKILKLLELLEDNGPLLPRPYADLLKDGIHELRVKLSGNQIRVLYFFCYKNFIVLTHSFRKTTDAVPKKEIKKAQKIRQDFLSRFTEKDLKEDYNENI